MGLAKLNQANSSPLINYVSIQFKIAKSWSCGSVSFNGFRPRNLCLTCLTSLKTLLVFDTHLREMVSQFKKKSQKHLDEKWRRSISAVQYITQSYEGFSPWARYVGIIFPENISEILNIFFGFLISKELNLNINVTFQMDRTTIVNRFKIF